MVQGEVSKYGYKCIESLWGRKVRGKCKDIYIYYVYLLSESNSCVMFKKMKCEGYDLQTLYLYVYINAKCFMILLFARKGLLSMTFDSV